MRKGGHGMELGQKLKQPVFTNADFFLPKGSFAVK